MTDKQLPWILAGYETFAREGPPGLKVERLSRQVGTSKSSFYHHFAGLEVFTEQLLAYHLLRAEEIAERERACQNVRPELIELIVAVKEDLLFNRQLRVHREQPGFQACFDTTSQLVTGAILDIWAEALGLQGQAHLAQMILALSLENFFLQITEETLTYAWMDAYVSRLQQMVQAFGVPPTPSSSP